MLHPHQLSGPRNTTTDSLASSRGTRARLTRVLTGDWAKTWRLLIRADASLSHALTRSCLDVPRVQALTRTSQRPAGASCTPSRTSRWTGRPARCPQPLAAPPRGQRKRRGRVRLVRPLPLGAHLRRRWGRLRLAQPRPRPRPPSRRPLVWTRPRPPLLRRTGCPAPRPRHRRRMGFRVSASLVRLIRPYPPRPLRFRATVLSAAGPRLRLLCPQRQRRRRLRLTAVRARRVRRCPHRSPRFRTLAPRPRTFGRQRQRRR